LRDDGTFGLAVVVPELNSLNAEQGIAVRRDGLEIVFGSNRPGGAGDFDLWSATRESTEDPWSAPINLAAANGPLTDGGKMTFTFDGRGLYFRSNREGAGDIFLITRDRGKGKK